MITTKVVKQGIIVLNCFLTRLHFYSHYISGWMSYPAAVWLPHSTSLLSPSFLKWLFVNKPLGSLTWDGGQDGLCRIVKWITRHSDDREMPVYIFKIRKSPPAYPWALPLHPQRKRPVAVGKWKESLSRNSGSSVLVSHTQIGVPELRTHCSDPWALLNDLHPLRLWMMGLKLSIQARSLRSVTQEERAWRMKAWRRREGAWGHSVLATTVLATDIAGHVLGWRTMKWNEILTFFPLILSKNTFLIHQFYFILTHYIVFMMANTK